MVIVFFFFKQKTAYEMRISDWSSDVCSSDLASGLGAGAAAGTAPARGAAPSRRSRSRPIAERLPLGLFGAIPPGAAEDIRDAFGIVGPVADEQRVPACVMRGLPEGVGIGFKQDFLFRSEEHTSELQSLMRISYAVFCLKKKTKQDKQ